MEAVEPRGERGSHTHKRKTVCEKDERIRKRNLAKRGEESRVERLRRSLENSSLVHATRERVAQDLRPFVRVSGGRNDLFRIVRWAFDVPAAREETRDKPGQRAFQRTACTREQLALSHSYLTESIL